MVRKSESLDQTVRSRPQNLDVKSAFHNGDLEEEVYVKQPTVFGQTTKPATIHDEGTTCAETNDGP